VGTDDIPLPDLLGRRPARTHRTKLAAAPRHRLALGPAPANRVRAAPRHPLARLILNANVGHPGCGTLILCMGFGNRGQAQNHQPIP